MERHERLTYFLRAMIAKKTTASQDSIRKKTKEAIVNIVKKAADGRVIISILSISAIACKYGKLYAAKTQ